MIVIKPNKMILHPFVHCLYTDHARLKVMPGLESWASKVIGIAQENDPSEALNKQLNPLWLTYNETYEMTVTTT